MNNAYLLLGSNLSDTFQQLEIAKKHIIRIGNIDEQSNLYCTAAWGLSEQPEFINQVIKIKTRYSPHDILKKIIDIEKKMGRVRTEKNAPRIIDIDILFYNDEIVSSADLIIPHPLLQYRRFVLVPLNELAPELLHPVLHKTVGELLAACTDTLDVKRF
ncbi:MAG: 2-amino-4-hydroxy-6-hydroxymethyldihydropteridine diphosphokinase [Ferruginibacter sp.]